MKFYDLIWLIPIFPLLGAIINGLVSNRLGLKKSVTNAVAIAGSGTRVVVGLGSHRSVGSRARAFTTPTS